MPYPRKYLIDDENPGVYHCISCCVRKAFLCGAQRNHRRQWLHDRLALLNETFAIDVLGYAFMSNHLHVILSTHPDEACKWSSKDIARRFVRLYPNRVAAIMKKPGFANRPRTEVEAAYIDRLAHQEDFIETWRQRLSTVSWHQKLLKEPIARRANEEDGCQGHFWEQRFRSIRLLDERAVLACMAYVDLNPIRAETAETLEESEHTSIKQRIASLENGVGGRKAARSKRTAKKSKCMRMIKHGLTLGTAAMIWLTPIEQLFQMTTASYVRFVANSGGVTTPQTADRQSEVEWAERLRVDPSQLRDTLLSTKPWFGSAIGPPDLLHEETRRRRAKSKSTRAYRRISSALRIY